MDVNEIILALFIPLVYGAVAGFFTGVVLFIFSIKQSKLLYRIHFASFLALMITFIPISIISLYFLFGENQKLVEINNGWLNVILLSIMLLAVVITSILEINKMKAEKPNFK